MIRQKNHGFTLIEVLIAMALLSIMMLLLFSSMRVSLRNWDAGEERVKKVSNAAAAHNFFRRHFAIIKPLYDDFTDDKSVFAFQGDQHKVKFVSPLPSSVGRLGLQVFTIELEPDEQRINNISVSLEPFFPTAEGKQWNIDKVVLISQVEALEFSYFGVVDFEGDDSEGDNSEEQATWNNQWLEQNTLPKLIKIAIRLEGGVVWPDIIIAPRIGKTSG